MYPRDIDCLDHNILCILARAGAAGGRANGNWKLARKLETGSWKLEAGNWQLETGNWQLEAGDWKLGWKLKRETGAGKVHYWATIGTLPCLSVALRWIQSFLLSALFASDQRGREGGRSMISPVLVPRKHWSYQDCCPMFTQQHNCRSDIRSCEVSTCGNTSTACESL